MLEAVLSTTDYPLRRGISVVVDNSQIVEQAQKSVQLDFVTESMQHGECLEHLGHSSGFSFVLPDLGSFELEFHEFLRKELVEWHLQADLEKSGKFGLV
jgi:hypothetical protein